MFTDLLTLFINKGHKMSKVTCYEANLHAFKAVDDIHRKPKLSNLFWIKLEESREMFVDVDGALGDFYETNKDLIKKCVNELIGNLGFAQIINYYVLKYQNPRLLIFHCFIQECPEPPLSYDDFWKGINLMACSLHFEENGLEALKKYNLVRSEIEGKNFIPIILNKM